MIHFALLTIPWPSFNLNTQTVAALSVSTVRHHAERVCEAHGAGVFAVHANGSGLAALTTYFATVRRKILAIRDILRRQLSADFFRVAARRNPAEEAHWKILSEP